MLPSQDKSESAYEYAAVLKNLRDEAFLNCTQEELARKIDASVFAVSKWERGIAQPHKKFQRRITELAQESGYPREIWPLKGIRAPRAIPSPIAQKGGES